MNKTVLPNTTRTIAPADPFKMAANAAAGRPSGGLTSRVAGKSSPSAGLPPVVALALEPKVERTISLQLSDIFSQIPSGYVKPVETIDVTRRVLLKASEVEKGMANGKPTVALVAIYEQVPEIFLRSVALHEPMHLPLPYDKVLEQFSSARVRSDQERDQAVPQVETPFLQVTIEDTHKFGTTLEPLQASALPPVKVETASAKSLSRAEPEMAVRETVAPPSTRSTIPLSELVSAAPEPPRAKAPQKNQPARIPFNLPPNGAGASASERVPASSGPPVPTRSAQPPSPPPFKVEPPCADLRPKLTRVPGVEKKTEAEENFAPPPKHSKQDEPKVVLPLQLILQSIPPFQLNGSPSNVPEELRISFPFSMIQPQLATGRVVVAPKTLQMFMPRDYRDMIVIDPAETPVQLPLQEVLKNLPGGALQMRDDQLDAEKGGAFETPFSIKAKEDAERFNVSAAPVASAAKGAEAVAEEKAEPEKIAEGKIDKDKIDIVPDTKFDAKEVVALASTLPGVAGCLVTFADGLSLAGNLPEDVAVGGLCAMAPSLLQRIEKHMLETKLGAMSAMTLHGEKTAVTFFMHGNIYLTALHSGAELGLETRSKLAEMAKQLSRTYA